ncbi:MAG: hypothetical protein ACREVR_07765 [Burkholderiales bacterium]
MLGIGVLLGCAGFYGSALAPAERELAAQRLAVERLKTRSPYQPVSAGGRAEELQRFYSLFPLIEKLTDALEQLYGLAREAKLELAQGEYRLEKRGVGLWSYRVNLPIRGTYPQIREFVGAALKAMPIASVDALRFERKKAGDTVLDAQVQLTLHFQPQENTQSR